MQLFKKVGHSRPFFIYFCLINTFDIKQVNNCLKINLADDWIQTSDLWYWKRPVYQLSHNHCPFYIYRLIIISGQDARATRNSFSAAFSSMFRRRSGGLAQSESSHNVASPESASQQRRSMQFSRRLTREVRQHALAAVILEEWLQELAAIAQELSLLQKEQVSVVGVMSWNKTVLTASCIVHWNYRKNK